MDKILECQICKSMYDDFERIPRVLKCHHNLCSVCLVELVKNSADKNFIECPFCRQKCESVLNEIPKSFIIMQLLELKKYNLISEQVKVEEKKQEQGNIEALSEQAICPMKVDLSVTSKPEKKWDLKLYLKDIFKQFDINGDGAISSIELQELLKNIRSDASFDPKTVYFLMLKYDINADNQISFYEFLDLYIYLEDEFGTFLLTDKDSSGSIEPEEFDQLLQSKGFNFSSIFLDFFFGELKRITNRCAIDFDLYIRITARLDFLLKKYNSNPEYKKEISIENYVVKTFFRNFF